MKAKAGKAWDVIVVGGGPAGMMAAGRAAERGRQVLLLEKNSSLGKKLLITGGGRCNVTNSEFDTRKLLAKFKESDKFLFSAFAQWAVKETLDFFHQRGMPTKVENELRTFPISNSAQSVWEVLVKYMEQNKVTVKSKSEVAEIVKDGKKITGVKLKNGQVVNGAEVIIATGGTSRPETGSTGDAYKWLQKLGHTITIPAPSLVPIMIKDPWVKKLAGLSVNDIKLTLYQNEVKQGAVKGKVLFTHFGVSGPTVLNMSKDVGELLKYGDVTLALDLLPQQDYGVLNANLQQLFKDHDKKNVKNALTTLIHSALVPIVLDLAQVDGEVKCHSIKRAERLQVVNALKHIPLAVQQLLGSDKAIITSGGVSLSEVDFKTMRSRLYPNLYLIGDILNIDRPSGGYSLQLCWTTGFVAGNASGN